MGVGAQDKVNILLVDDQPGKLLSYEAVLKDLDENLVKANSAREALEHMLKIEVAVILLDVAMPELDGFQLAEMIRDHPRFQKTAIIFISAIQVDEVDRLRGYEIGAVDYVPVPVVPEVLRAKVRVFLELYRKTQELERLNAQLEQRVSDRTAELEASNQRLLQSEERRTLALAAGHMGSWEIDLQSQMVFWDDAKCRIFGIDTGVSHRSMDDIRPLIHPDDWHIYQESHRTSVSEGQSGQTEFRIIRPNGEVRWCVSASAASQHTDGQPIMISGVTIDITERKEAEQRQSLLAREVDHRARNALAVVQSILRLTRADSIEGLVAALDGRIQALARAHTLLSNTRWQGADLVRLVTEEMDPYRNLDSERVIMSGPALLLRPSMAQAFALVLHELATNAAKYGALSSASGRVLVNWELTPESLVLRWCESGGPATHVPTKNGFGTRVVTASIERELQGRATFNWRPEGLECILAVPRADVTERIQITRQGGSATGQPMQPVGPSSSEQKRVLLVEDETLVAMMMREMLVDLGYAVVGPMNDKESALAAAQQGGIDCAILDLNLDGFASYPIADELAARAIPFLFLTGYDKEAVDRRYASVPLLQKPVDEQSLRQSVSTLLLVDAPASTTVQAQSGALAG
jgi:PAS domain S-box-containing protein